MPVADLGHRVAEHPFWWHSIELGDGVVTPGHKPLDVLEGELESLRLPDLHGKTVLDIGAWDGFFSFAAERLGARRVVALDFHTWGTDMWALRNPKESVSEAATLWDANQLPGKRGFDLACQALDSRVESVFGDVLTLDPAELGTFDVVLFLGVLYHTRYPLEMLERVSALTAGTMVLETESFSLPGQTASLAEFFETDELAGDASNWWSFTEPALTGMCRSSGFSEVAFLQPYHRSPPEGSGLVRHRALAHVATG